MAMKVTVRQLQVFDAVATLGSVTAAANRLNMSQSAASAALMDLQIVLGRTLFTHAKGRSLQITEEGRQLRVDARWVLGKIEDMQTADRDAPLTGKLVIGATSMIAETDLARLCIEFRKIHPGVHIQVLADAVGELFERLKRFELETALIEYFPAMEDVELIHWKTDELVLVVAPDHPLAGRERLTIKDLAGLDWCMREPYSSMAARLRYMLHEEVGQLPIVFETTSNVALRNAVLAGGGIGCMSRALVQFDIENGRLIELVVDGFAYTRSLSLARPRNMRRSRLLTAFDDFVLGAAAR